MRELVFKNLTSIDKKRKDLYISETTEKDGVKTVTMRHSLYIVEKRYRFYNQEELIEWQNVNAMKSNKRHIFICKKRDSKLQKDSFLYYVVGKFYAVINDEVYPITFKHSFEIDFLATQYK